MQGETMHKIVFCCLYTGILRRLMALVVLTSGLCFGTAPFQNPIQTSWQSMHLVCRARLAVRLTTSKLVFFCLLCFICISLRLGSHGKFTKQYYCWSNKFQFMENFLSFNGFPYEVV